MDLRTLLHRRVVYPLALELLGEGSLPSALDEMRSMQWWSADELQRHAIARLRRILRHAQEHVPYYRPHLGGRAIDSDDEVRAAHAALPLLTKAELQSSFESLRALPPPRRIARKTTGGSTGQAVTVLKDREALARARAAMWLGYSWSGIAVGDRCARFWGSATATRRRLVSLLSDVAMNRLRFSAFAFDDEDLARYWDAVLRAHPTWFYGYVSMLAAFAEYVERRRLPAHLLGLKAIVTTSEVLSGPQRQLLERVFQAPVQVEYGCGEVGPIAYECERGGLHLLATELIVEVLRPDGRPAAPGETGEIVLTDLNNLAMPLLRYRIADFGVVGTPCACGRALPTLERIWGRAYDFVETPDGKRYHGEFFMYLMEDLRSAGCPVRAFQVDQTAADALTVRLVTDPSEEPTVRARVADGFRRRLPSMAVTIESVPRIERAASGKMRVIRNLFSPPADPVPAGAAHE